MIDIKELERFVVEAKMNTWAGNGKEIGLKNQG